VFVVMNRFYVKPEYATQFEAQIQNRPRQVDRQPGFVRVQLLRPSNPDDPYIVLTVWNTRQDFEAWVKADTFTVQHAGPRTLANNIFTRPNQLETFEVLLDIPGTYLLTTHPKTL
jgi:heme-degrading monooxygenase HmoA